MVRFGVSLLTRLLLALALVAACGGDVRVALVPGGNDPIPLPPDVELMLRDQTAGLAAADGTPAITADDALQIGGKTLGEEMEGNNVPSNNPPGPIALVRRAFVAEGRPGDARRPVNVWIVAYRWKFNCHDPNGGPGPCPTTSFYFVDDKTGVVISSYGVS